MTLHDIPDWLAEEILAALRARIAWLIAQKPDEGVTANLIPSPPSREAEETA